MSGLFRTEILFLLRERVGRVTVLLALPDGAVSQVPCVAFAMGDEGLGGHRASDDPQHQDDQTDKHFGHRAWTPPESPAAVWSPNHTGPPVPWQPSHWSASKNCPKVAGRRRPQKRQTVIPASSPSRDHFT
jgi:hypothetical protein